MNPDPSAAGGAELSVCIRQKLSGNFTLEAELRATPGFTILFGPSGSGKTTLLHCIAGLRTPDSGRIALGPRVVFDRDMGANVPVRLRSIGYLFQTLALFPHLSVEQNIQYGIASLPSALRNDRTAQILESFRIAHVARRKPAEISGGERQRAALARSLVTDPALLLLDEPLSALDRSAKSKIIEDLKAWNAARAIPIIYVTHSPDEAFALGERVVVLEAGRIVAEGTPQQVLRTPRHQTVAQLAGFENIFDAAVTALHEDQGTMSCRLGGGPIELETPIVPVRRGAAIRVAIRAGDIMLAAERPAGLSARNIFRGRLISLQQRGVTVIATVDSGVKFEVHLTPGACRQLHLQSGQDVWMVLKTYSCHLVQPSPPPD
jgi:molybdate transport system ATP-binding protein